jgi:hypothetical protein
MDGQKLIVNGRDSGCGPGGILRDASLVEGVDVTAQHSLGARHGDVNLAGIERRVSSQGIGDLFFYRGCRHPWLPPPVAAATRGFTVKRLVIEVTPSRLFTARSASSRW